MAHATECTQARRLALPIERLSDWAPHKDFCLALLSSVNRFADRRRFCRAAVLPLSVCRGLQLLTVTTGKTSRPAVWKISFTLLLQGQKRNQTHYCYWQVVLGYCITFCKRFSVSWHMDSVYFQCQPTKNTPSTVEIWTNLLFSFVETNRRCMKQEHSVVLWEIRELSTTAMTIRAFEDGGSVVVTRDRIICTTTGYLLF